MASIASRESDIQLSKRQLEEERLKFESYLEEEKSDLEGREKQLQSEQEDLEAKKSQLAVDQLNFDQQIQA